MEKTKEILIKVENLDKHFKVGKKKVLKAVDNVSLDIYKGETFGLVGESGCGKTTIGRTILNLHTPTNGHVYYDGVDTQSMKSTKEIKEFKKKAQIIFQDPYASLDSRMTIGDIIAEGLSVHFPEWDSKRVHQRVSNLLEIVGLNAEHGARFPHELSGGQRQRIGIARALAVEPQFIVCDEPISALDVSIQAQVVNLLIEMQQSLGLTYLFISHDLSMVKHISDRIGVMYLGSLVEVSPKTKLYNKPLHPYTQALISAIPIPDPDADSQQRIRLKGEIPSPINSPSGCKFRTRCEYCMNICKDEKPLLREIEKDHHCACHLYNPDRFKDSSDKYQFTNENVKSFVYDDEIKKENEINHL